MRAHTDASRQKRSHRTRRSPVRSTHPWGVPDGGRGPVGRATSGVGAPSDARWNWSGLAALLRNAREQCTDLRLAVTAVPAERANGRELASLGPACDRL